jgi:diguanylate cyclase (GGDEF)-like protein/PAS domain S-box-containing protein
MPLPPPLSSEGSRCVSNRRWTVRGEAEQRRLILEAAENGMLLVDAAGVVVLANSAAERVLGYPPGALGGRPAEILACAEIRAAVSSLCERSTYVDPLGISALGGGCTVRHADGSDFPIEILTRKLSVRAGQLILISMRTPRRGLSGDQSDTAGQSAEENALPVRDVKERQNAQRERERLSEYATLANRAAKVGIWELDLTTNISSWDRNMYAIYGLDDSTIVPTFEMWNAALHPHDRELAAREIKTDIAGGEPSNSEFRVIWQNGEIHTIRSLATLVADASGTATRIIGTDWDVTEIRVLAEALREEKDALISSEARYRALTEAMPQMVWVTGAAGPLEYVNDRWLAYTHFALERTRGLALDGLVHPADTQIILTHRQAQPPQEFECEARFRRFDGSYRWHLVRSVPFRDGTGAAGKWITTATDIEERKAAEKTLAATVAELEHRAHHDSMTDLPNRMLLMERLAEAIARAKRADGGVLVLYVDLDRFKAVNDSLGHAAGDAVLRETGLRIVATLRAGDTASRIGGDEFVVVCATSGPGDDVSHLGARLIDVLTAPIDIGGEPVVVEASIGMSVYPADGLDADTLIRKADAAMYSAKQSGRNTFRLYSNEAHIAIVAASELEGELRHAIAAGELVVHYQPIIGLRAGRPTAAEALVRWQHPRRGLVPPGEFIAFAEERGLIAQIGDVVLQASCEMLERLRRSGHGDLSIAVNVSAHQFGKPGFVAGIIAALNRYQTDPARLTIEITESVVMGNTRETIAKLAELRRLGVRLSIDDFGTGYSSLAYIKKFPINTLKIDRSFVRDIADDQTDQAIAKTIITLAHSLGMRVVAEGVETQAQLAMLDSFGVDNIQGYVFSRPLGELEFARFIDTFARSQVSAARSRSSRVRRRPRLAPPPAEAADGAA